MVTISKIQRTFSDLDLNFTAHPVTGDVPVLYDENAIRRSIRNLLSTSNFERPFHSEIGAQIRTLLFEPAGAFFNTTLKRVISDTIATYEPRVVINSIIVNSSQENNSVFVGIVFTIVNTVNPVTLNVVLQRTR